MNIYQPFAARARAVPDAPAVLTKEGALSYAELDRAVSWAAARYLAAGIAPRDHVAIDLQGQAQYLVASIALARIGAAQIALQPAEPSAVRAEIARRLRLAATVAEPRAGLGARLEPPPGELDDLKALRAAPVEAASDGALPFLIKRSSGTTRAVFKLAVMTHAMRGPTYEHLPSETRGSAAPRVLHTAHVSFLTTMSNLPRILGAGGCLVFYPAGARTDEVVEVVARHRVDVFYGGPVHAEQLLVLAREGELLLPGLRVFNMSSTMVPDALRRAIRERITRQLQIRYSTTETGAISVAPPGSAAEPAGTVGRLLPGVEAEVVDARGAPLPCGQRGTLRVRTPWMSLAYLDEPEETRRAFREGWFHVADLVERTAGGELVHHGRADDLMIIDGFNVTPGEIEQVLLRHPGVVEAAAFGERSAAHGSIPMAAVVLKPPFTGEELPAHCRSWLGARSPRKFLVLPRLPRSAAGKVLRRELLALLQAEGRKKA